MLEGKVEVRAADSMTLLVGNDLRLTITSDTGSISESAWISIRPEKIRVSRDPLSGPNVFNGTVARKIFRGATDQLVLQTTAGLELMSVAANGQATDSDIHRGDSVFFQIHADDVVMLRNEKVNN